MFTLCILVTVFIPSVCGNSWCSWGTYGDACDKICSAHCRPRPHTNTVHCHIETGLCSEGCIAGWYGDECNKGCSKNCMNNICSHEDGTCTVGCKDGKKGNFCEEENNERKSKEGTENAWIAFTFAAVVGMAMMVAIVIILVIVCVRLCHNRRGPSTVKDGDHETSSFISNVTQKV
ncbi:multiple epidermal growth factor-like domains protein 10 [Haliotis rufescens]|uniref:multiple epidermal growth factor-like domains protein 10 n=1 Tax=Haliotis rufescens TaxID=6454 RepID=UPI00201F526A|nr:multiple epidermal growth factor-like domains protein 10 [Haliotis rufescens]